MDKLAGRVAVVTGGGSGLGKAIAAALLAEGASVVISGRDIAKLQLAQKELGSADRVLALTCDVGEANQCRTLIEKATAHFGKIDILINNAGTNLKERTFRELTPEAWDQLLATNLSGAFYCTHFVLPQMFARHDGVIVNIVSVAGKRANPLGGAAYVASKFGMGGMGMCLSNEERESGVRVSNIYPGEIDTPILDARPRPVTNEQRAVILKPEDVAAAVLFVATLPQHVSVPELVIKPTTHPYW
jgi:NADP-dependent 3-hydroxy acid dehydrogenase YdfG